jgi:peptidoglycan/LPS O-acetylase OafA/YrhL
MKFQSLEAFRGLAAIMVVLFHSIFYSAENPNALVLHSDLFVDFFFVLSGFVMSHAYVDKIKFSLSFQNFIMIRFARLYPLHLFTLFVWVPYVLIQIYAYQHGMGSTNPAEKQNILSFLMNLFFLQSFAADGGAGWNWPSWSIAVEFFLYILFYFYVRLAKNIRCFPAVLLVLGVYFLLYQFDNPLRTDSVAFLRGIGGFFSGFVLYQLFQKTRFTLEHKFYTSVLELLAIGLMMYTVSTYSAENKMGYFAAIASFVGIVYLFAIQANGLISQLMHTTLFQLFGKLSFSIYLVHGIILAVSSNIAVYIFKLPKITLSTGNEAIVLNYAFIINSVLLIIIIFISRYTYRYIEKPWMTKAKNKVLESDNK